jgi:hypothetical protein
LFLTDNRQLLNPYVVCYKIQYVSHYTVCVFVCLSVKVQCFWPMWCLLSYIVRQSGGSYCNLLKKMQIVCLFQGLCWFYDC